MNPSDNQSSPRKGKELSSLMPRDLWLAQAETKQPSKLVITLNHLQPISYPKVKEGKIYSSLEYASRLYSR